MKNKFMKMAYGISLTACILTTAKAKTNKNELQPIGPQREALFIYNEVYPGSETTYVFEAPSCVSATVPPDVNSFESEIVLPSVEDNRKVPVRIINLYWFPITPENCLKPAKNSVTTSVTKSITISSDAKRMTHFYITLSKGSYIKETTHSPSSSKQK